MPDVDMIIWLQHASVVSLPMDPRTKSHTYLEHLIIKCLHLRLLGPPEPPKPLSVPSSRPTGGALGQAHGDGDLRGEGRGFV